MNVISIPKELTKILNKHGRSIGFVPTMGALHKGHISLIEKSKEENEITVVSIFVNPTQFNDPKDFKNYPNRLDKDISILSSLSVDYVFTPENDEIYNDNYAYTVTEKKLSKKLCGATREGHFEGVLTIVMKLLNIVNPTKAYFGEKDYQQYLLIKGMADSFYMKTEIVSLPTIRENDGLALSSRNLQLKDRDREKANKFYELLVSDFEDKELIEQLNKEGFKVDYVESIDNRRFGAVFLGNVRLIDNVKK